MLSLYREQLKAMARALDQEGLSQTAIGKELGVPRRTISDWLSVNVGNDREAEIAKPPNPGGNHLAVETVPRYLVVCQAVEKFRPPDGLKNGIMARVMMSIKLVEICRMIDMILCILNPLPSAYSPAFMRMSLSAACISRERC